MKVTKLSFLLLALQSFLCLCQVIPQTYSTVGPDVFFQDASPNNPGIGYKYYNVQPGLSVLPDFSQLTPASFGVTPNIALYDIVPNADNLDFFGILFEGYIYIEEPGVIEFRLTSDDGSKLFIDGVEIIDNDGIHPPKSVEGSVFLTKGYHSIRVPYWENSGVVALDLKWKIGPYQIVVNPPSLTAEDFANGIAQFEVALSRRPSSRVVITIVNPSESVVLSKCQLVFDPSNYGEPQTVSVIPVSSFDSESSSFELILTISTNDTNYSSLNTPTVSVGKDTSAAAKCISWGDPHFTTFDGRKHNFQGTGVYYLMRTLNAEVVVQALQDVCGPNAQSVTCNFGVALKYKNSVIAMYLDRQGNPTLEKRSEVDPGVGLKITGTEYLFTFPEGTKVTVKVGFWGARGIYYFNIYITSPGYQQNRVRGLCGDFDGNSNNDFAPASNQQDFGLIWLADETENLFNWPNTQISVIPDPNGDDVIEEAEFEGTPVTCNPNWDGPEGPPGSDDADDVLQDLPVTQENNTLPSGDFNFTEPEWSSPEFEEEATDLCDELFFSGPAAVECNQILGETDTAQGFYEACLFDAKGSDDLGFASSSVSGFLELCQDNNDNNPPPNTCPNLCSLNGNCTENGECVCFDGFKGIDCSQQDLPPVVNEFGSNVDCYPEGGALNIKGNYFSRDLAWTCLFDDNSVAPVQFVSQWLMTCKIPASYPPGSNFIAQIPQATGNQIVSSVCEDDGQPDDDSDGPQPPPCTRFPCEETFDFQDSTYSTKDFNVISYNDFTVKTGDVEGRVLVRNNFNADAGYSVGHLLLDQEDYSQKPFSLIALNNVDWKNGALFPEQEDMFVGDSLTTNSPFGIALERKGGNCSICEKSPCCDAVEAALESHYACAAKKASDSRQQTSVTYEYKYNGLFFNCSQDQFIYYANVDASDFSAATWYSLQDCTSNAFWEITILAQPGEQVKFTGDWFPARNGKVTYIVSYEASVVENRDIGDCAGQVLVETDVNGNILAPHSSITQRGGVVRGSVVACNYNVTDAMQINIPCDDSILETLEYKGYITQVEGSNKRQSSSSLAVPSRANAIVGDKLTLCPGCANEETVTVLEIQANALLVTPPTNQHSDEQFSFKWTPGRVFEDYDAVVGDQSPSPTPSSSPSPTSEPVSDEESSAFANGVSFVLFMFAFFAILF